ncbi:MFS transporter [Paenibacillus sp. FSL M8-0228]|uniref:MFS transporter n=1 Tax=Paenibacillus TaxID=44249 RepID=UPI00210B20D9|nr:MFS transporter [Paenibacillus polymyxa]
MRKRKGGNMSILTRNRGAMLLLMLNIFLAFMGIGLVVPVLPKFISELGMNGSSMGLMVAAFALTQLLLSPLSGKLSDRYGRKKLIVSGMFIFMLSELVFGLAHSIPTLFIARIMGGAGAALLTPSIMAYVADVTSFEERGKGMGMINAAINTGFIIGPGIGGLLATYGIRIPFFAAAGAAGIAAILSVLVLPESLSKEKQQYNRELPRQKENLLQQFAKSYQSPYFMGLLIVFVVAFGLANFETVFGLFVDHKYGFTPMDIAIIITTGSILGAVVQATIFGWIINRFGEKKVIHLCLAIGGLFIFLTLFAEQYMMIMLTTFIIFLAMDILRPAVSTSLSRQAGDEQGFVAGMNSSYTSLGNVIGPLIAGLLFDVHINLPYMVAAIALLACLVLSLRSKQAGEQHSIARAAEQHRGR